MWSSSPKFSQKSLVPNPPIADIKGQRDSLKISKQEGLSYNENSQSVSSPGPEELKLEESSEEDPEEEEDKFEGEVDNHVPQHFMYGTVWNHHIELKLSPVMMKNNKVCALALLY